VEKLPDEFNMYEIMNKVPPEERTPYVIVAFQECERMNGLTNEIRRSLKELDLGLKVSHYILVVNIYTIYYLQGDLLYIPYTTYRGNLLYIPYTTYRGNLPSPVTWRT